MNQKPRSPGPIPNRWLYCPRKSESIIAERFIAFKTPLSKAYNDQMPIKCLFLPEMIFGWCKTIKIKLGLWIDLTNTKRFYDRKVVEENGASYVKLNCKGHGETPSKEQTRSFIEIVDDFIEEHPFDIIGVHCTHGFNRTGFLIVSYLVERLDCSVEAALACFAQARPPGIYKQDYINELYQRYESGEDAIVAPELPAWCYDYDEDAEAGTSQHAQKRSHDEAQFSGAQQNGEDVNNGEGEAYDGCEGDDQGESGEGNAGESKKKRKREGIIKNATFMQGVPGVHVVYDQPRLQMIQRKVQDMCGWKKSGFPGSQPVSMDRTNLKNLVEMPYRVSWKADGTRYMMLINKKDDIYFIDRNNSCFQVENITFLKAGNLNEHLEDTLVDGEMVIDHVKDTSIPRYLIYDVVKICNKDIGKRPFFPDRLSCMKHEIIGPRHAAMIQRIIDRNAEPFSVRLKDFWEIKDANKLLSEKFAKSLSHEPDGLIFQPSEMPYTPGVCPKVLKWKPHELNSVDFLLKIIKEGGQGMIPKKVGLLYVLGHETYVDKIPYTREIKDLNNKIIECTANQKGQWKFLRERTDKTLPNSFKTATAVVESIRNPVTKEILLSCIAHCGKIEDRKKFEDHNKMPPPASHYVHRNQQQHNQQQHQEQQQLVHHEEQSYEEQH